MRIPYSLAALALAASLSAPAAAQAPAIKWGPAPAVFPAGMKFAVLQGDPGKAGVYTVRLDMPNGYTIKPHYHPTDEHVTVISGTLLVGMGDKVATDKAMRLPRGGFITAPAQAHHFAVARGHTVVQVHGLGPFQLTYVNPADDPTRKTAAKK